MAFTHLFLSHGKKKQQKPPGIKIPFGNSLTECCKLFLQKTITTGLALPFYDKAVFILEFHVEFQIAIMLQWSHNIEFHTITERGFIP